MSPEAGPPLLLELPAPRVAARTWPWWGLAAGAAAGVLVGHPVAMVVQNFQDAAHGLAAFAPLAALRHSFHLFMWPMILLYAVAAGIAGAVLGYVFRRLEENRQLLKLLHHEFELQVATLRHHYKNLALGISGFSRRVRHNAAALDECWKKCAEQNCPQCSPFQDELAALEKNVGVLDDASRRLSDTLGHELLFLKALSGGLAPERRDLYPLLQTAVRDLLSLRFQEKNPRVEINGRPWEEAREHLVWSFEPCALEVILENLLSNAMKYGDHIQVGVEVAGARLRLTIRDNGPGLDVAKLKGFLATPGDRRETESTRLGLMVSLHLLEKLGGRLWAASSPGTGAALILEVPEQPARPCG